MTAERLRAVTRTIARTDKAQMWALLGEELPALSSGRPRDPYMEQGCHPDIVSRVWDELGASLPADWRTVMTWSGGSTTDLAQCAGPGWIWGRWYEPEPRWVLGAYLATRPAGTAG